MTKHSGYILYIDFCITLEFVSFVSEAWYYLLIIIIFTKHHYQSSIIATIQSLRQKILVAKTLSLYSALLQVPSTGRDKDGPNTIVALPGEQDWMNEVLLRDSFAFHESLPRHGKILTKLAVCLCYNYGYLGIYFVYKSQLIPVVLINIKFYRYHAKLGFHLEHSFDSQCNKDHAST